MSTTITGQESSHAPGSMAESDSLAELRARIGRRPGFLVGGSVVRVAGHEVEVRGLRLRVGDAITIGIGEQARVGEIVALGQGSARAVVFGETDGIGSSDPVFARAEPMRVVASRALLGRVIDALGRPMDGLGPVTGERISLDGEIPSPLLRRRIVEPLPVGVRVLDTLCTAGRGQRMGIFGGSGVGKSTILGMMARGTAADVNVLALVGERGREVREFIEDDLGPEGLARTVVVVATSDQPALVRLRAGELATRLAEWFADDGSDVLLMVDSLTRLAMAQRDVGLAAGEPPTARGFTPSVFSMMPALLERSGPRTHGSVTAFYTVLVEGDDMNDPIADAARSILDGHVVLDRELAIRGQYPAIDPLASLSRLAAKVVERERLAAATAVRSALAAVYEVRDLVEVGAYVPGTNPEADRGLAVHDAIVAFLAQAPDEPSDFDLAWSQLEDLAVRAG